MTAIIPKITNHSAFWVGLLLSDNLPYIKDDAFFYAFLGALGAFIGQILYIAKRDQADVDNKYKFFYWRDVLFTIGWMLVGGFFPLVASLPDVPDKLLFLPTPVVPIAVSPFISRLYDVMDKKLPERLARFLDEWDDKKKGQVERTNEKEIEREHEETKK